MPRRMNRSDRTSITSIALSLRATRNLPEYRHPVVHFCPLPPKEATRPEAHHFLRKYEFCSWKNADCCCAVFWSRKSSRAGIEVVGHKLVADLCRTRFDAVQAVVAHVAISTSIPPNCLEKWRKISRYAVSSHSCQQSRLTARARPSPGAALLGQHARGVVSFPYAPRAGGAYDNRHRTAGIAGRTPRRGDRVAAGGACAAAGREWKQQFRH